MYTIIQKIYEENKKILQEGLKKVFKGEDISSLTVAIKDFTDIMGKEKSSSEFKIVSKVDSNLINIQKSI